MTYYCPVQTCEADLFRNRLLVNLWQIPNDDLTKRLEVRSKKMLWWSTWILELIDEVCQLDENYWMTVSIAEIDAIYDKLSFLTNQEFSPLLLIVEVVGDQLKKREAKAFLQLISSREIVKALILDQSYADQIIADFNVELMKSP